MATSGKIQGTTKNSSGSNVSSKYGTWIEWKRNSNSIANNTSNITVTVYVQRIDSYSGETAYDLTQKPSVSLYVGGVAKTPTVNYIDTRNHKLCTVATWTGDVSHNSDGSLSLALSCSYSTQLSYLKSGSISGTAVLDTIPRASTFDEIRNNTIGKNCTVVIDRKSTSFTHQVWYKIGDSGWYDLGKNHTDNCVFNIDIALANKITTSMVGKINLCVRTFNGTTQIGSDYYQDFDVYVPDYSVSISDIKLTGNNLLNGTYVQGKSTVSVEITASSMHGATINSYSATVDGKTYSGNKFTSSVLSNGSKTVSVTVKDTRGKTATLSSSEFTVYAYFIPSITEFTVERQADETTVIAYIKGSISDVNNKNTKSVWITIGDDSKELTTGYTVDGSLTFTNVPTDITLTCGVAFNDWYTRVTKETVLPTVEVTMDFHHSGKGIAMGKVSETEGLLDIAWKTQISDTNWETLKLKRNGATGAVTVNFINDAGSLGYIGMTGNAANTLLRRWTSDGVTQYTILDNSFVKDYVVEQGTSGVWFYRKWNSGFAECHGYHTVSGLNISTAWGSWYSSSVIVLPSFPFTFSGSPDVHVSWESDFSAIIDGVGKRESTKAGQVYLYRPVAQTNVNGRFSIYAYGRWK